MRSFPFASWLGLILIPFLLLSCYKPVLEPMAPVTGFDPSNAILKSNVMARLARVLSSNLILSGQQCGHVGYNYSNDWLQAGGRTAAVMGIDLGYEDASGDYRGPIGDAAAHFERGGLVTMSFHPRNPATGGDVKALGGVDFDRILKPGTEVGSNWRGMVQNLGNIFQALKERHVIVLWRPLHEMNGDWFWWGSTAGPSTAQYVALWRDLHQELTVKRQLDNLLWVYAPNYVFDESKMKSVLERYPGAEYVDVAGLDVYADSFATLESFKRSYQDLSTLGKPLVLAELGPPNDASRPDWDLMAAAGIRQGFALAYALVWHSWPGHPVAIRDNARANDYMNDARVVTLDEMPGL